MKRYIVALFVFLFFILVIHLMSGAIFDVIENKSALPISGHVSNTVSEMAEKERPLLDSTYLLEKLALYPPAPEGFKRQVISLPTLNDENEHNAKIELIVGKMMEVDCNKRLLSGTLIEKNLAQLGYNYYVLSEVKGPISTLMACPDDTKQNQFVNVKLTPEEKNWHSYNSQLPLVIYVPQDIQVRYRIWHESDVIYDAINQ